MRGEQLLLVTLLGRIIAKRGGIDVFSYYFTPRRAVSVFVARRDHENHIDKLVRCVQSRGHAPTFQHRWSVQPA